MSKIKNGFTVSLRSCLFTMVIMFFAVIAYILLLKPFSKEPGGESPGAKRIVYKVSTNDDFRNILQEIKDHSVLVLDFNFHEHPLGFVLRNKRDIEIRKAKDREQVIIRSTGIAPALTLSQCVGIKIKGINFQQKKQTETEKIENTILDIQRSKSIELIDINITGNAFAAMYLDAIEGTDSKKDNGCLFQNVKIDVEGLALFVKRSGYISIYDSILKSKNENSVKIEEVSKIDINNTEIISSKGKAISADVLELNLKNCKFKCPGGTGIFINNKKTVYEIKDCNISKSLEGIQVSGIRGVIDGTTFEKNTTGGIISTDELKIIDSIFKSNKIGLFIKIKNKIDIVQSIFLLNNEIAIKAKTNEGFKENITKSSAQNKFTGNGKDIQFYD